MRSIARGVYVEGDFYLTYATYGYADRLPTKKFTEVDVRAVCKVMGLVYT